MAWDFETEPDFQQKLDWMGEFVREEIEPLDVLFNEPGAPYDTRNATTRKIIEPLQEEVKKRDLWACHIGPDLGGMGYGQLKLALMNEILGRSGWAPRVFGCQAPDSGNAEILAHYGTPAQKKQYLEPLLNGDIVSCYSMTEPQAGSDPRGFTCQAAKERRLDDQRREVVLVQRGAGGVPDRHGDHGHRRPDPPGRFDVPGACRYAGCRVRAASGDRHGAVGPGRARLHPLRERARPRGEPSRGTRAGVQHRADAARRRSRAPRDAHRRTGQARVRHDVRAGAVARDRRRAAGAQAEHSGGHRPFVRGDRRAPTSQQSRCRRPRSCRTSSAGRCTCTARSACRTRCR